MTVLDRLKSKVSCSVHSGISYPAWANAGTTATRELFDAAQLEISRVRQLIVENKIASNSENVLVLAKIARLAGRDKSLLNARRQPELCNWIDQQNVELKTLLSKCKAQAKTTSTRSVKEFQRENAELRRQLKSQLNLELKSVVEAFFSSNVLYDKEQLVRDNRKLTIEVERQAEIILKMKDFQKRQHDLIAIIMGILTPQQRASIQWTEDL